MTIYLGHGLEFFFFFFFSSVIASVSGKWDFENGSLRRLRFDRSNCLKGLLRNFWKVFDIFVRYTIVFCSGRVKLDWGV